MPDGVPHIAVSDTGWLTDHVWQLTGDLQASGGAHVIPLPSGRLGAGWGTGLIQWEVAGHHLRLIDQTGMSRAVFDCHAAPANALLGIAVPDGKPCRVDRLHRLPPPITAAPPRIPGERRNLVILRAGPDSLHTAWLQDCPDDARNWDLCLCTYAANVPQTRAEHRFHADGSKFEGLTALLASHDFWLAYDYVWFPDDDLLADWQDINRLFALCRTHDLALAQPSLQPGSFVNHPITLRTDGLLLRFTSFVEIMAPVFSGAALRRAAPTFALNPSGYGLDHLWPAMIDASPNTIAVLDAVAVLHTRPIGASYDQQRAMRDGWAIEHAFHQVNRYQVSGAITASPAGYAKRHGTIIADG